MGDFLMAETIAVLLLAVVAVITTGDVSLSAATAMTVLLVATPLVRVLWLVLRWSRRGDPKFALVGMTVLAVVASGWLLSR